MISLVLAEDQAMVRGALSALLRLEGDFQISAECEDGQSAWESVQRLKPDLLVTDIEMPHVTGLELASRVQQADLPTPVICAGLWMPVCAVIY